MRAAALSSTRNGIPVTIVPPLEKTDGVILKTLIEKYGVLPPEILIK